MVVIQCSTNIKVNFLLKPYLNYFTNVVGVIIINVLMFDNTFYTDTDFQFTLALLMNKSVNHNLS